jgi:microcystin-dependent protein
MGSGCEPKPASGACANIISSNCVRYEGPPVPLLKICTGDTITETQQAIIEKLIDLTNGVGINLEAVTLKNCQFLLSKFPAGNKTLQSLFQLLIDSSCLLKSEIDDLRKLIADSGDNISFDLKCIVLPSGKPDSTKVIQALINTLCLLSQKVTDIIQNAGNTTIISATINQALAGLISTPGNNGLKKTTAASGRVSYSITAVVPPGAMLPYSGSLSHFDGSGKGLPGTVMEGWYLCNGNNGTFDMRGFIPVGIIQGAGGQALDATVDPVSNSDVTMNYVMGQSGGKARVALDITQMPSHSHPLNDPGHAHEYNYPNQDSFSGKKFDASTHNNPSSRGTSLAYTGITIGAAGGGFPHENRMPYKACAFITRFD